MWKLVTAFVLAVVLAASSVSWGQGAWVTPVSWATGDRITMELLNRGRDNLTWLYDRIRNLRASDVAPSPDATRLYRGDDSWYQVLDANGRMRSGVLGSGTPANGQVLLYGDGGPAWNYPFEFPRTRLGVDVSQTSGINGILTSTIAGASNITAMATVTVTQTGSGFCRVRFYRAGLTSFAGVTTITSAPGRLTMTVSRALAAAASVRGRAVAVTLSLEAGARCAIAAGNATLVLS